MVSYRAWYLVWVLGRVEKKCLQRVKNIYFGLNKYQSVTHFSTCIFQGLKNIVFRSVALVTKKLWDILDFFFTDQTFFPPCILPYKLERKKF